MSSLPKIGERVIYFVSETESIFADVVDVTFWDCIAIKLPGGAIVHGVRRVVTVIGKDDKFERIPPIVGRFVRVVDGY